MSNVYRLPEREEAMPEAFEWIARLERGLTEEERMDLRAWLAGHPRRTDALLEAAALWDRMGSLSRLADLFPRPAPRTGSREPLAGHSSRFRFAIAASLAVAAAVSGYFMFTKPGGLPGALRQPEGPAQVAQEQIFETAIGEHSTIRLPDGSELTLNTNSRVRAAYDDAGRTLRLERGEMYVRVAHDAARPLTVWAGDRLVRAVGTAFNVQITPDQRVEVIVTDGKVLIGVMRANTTVPETAWIEAFDTTVSAGQRAVLSDQEQAVQDIGSKEIDVKLSWREGNLIFHGEPLAQALGEIERYTRVTFVIRDEELKAIRVAGLFRAGDVDGLLATLRENFNIAYERVGAEKIVLKNE
jgi:transmembrane sensor